MAITSSVTLAGAALVLAGIAGCGSAASSAPNPPPAAGKLEDVNSRVLSACTRFGLNAYAQVLKGEPDKNVMISPPSISLALSMAYNGARGTTQQAMAAALQIQGMSLEDVNKSNQTLIAALQSVDPKVTLAIANSLWAKKGLPLDAGFVERCRTFYSAEATTLDFTDPNAPAAINNWVSAHTGGKIPTIVDNIPPEMVLYLINAIYFKGMWATPFDTKATSDATFHLAGGGTSPCRMMRRTGKMLYAQGDEFQAVALPYGSGRVSMYVFLPAAGTSLDALQAKLSADTWAQWVGRLRNTDVDLSLPKFTFDYDVQLKDALTALGMGVAFSPQDANLSGMIDLPAGNAYISEVKHKTHVEVNEEGTTAAAATSIGIGATAVIIPARMVVDRPFLFAIRDNPTGTILFLGCVRKP